MLLYIFWLFWFYDNFNVMHIYLLISQKAMLLCKLCKIMSTPTYIAEIAFAFKPIGGYIRSSKINFK